MEQNIDLLVLGIEKKIEDLKEEVDKLLEEKKDLALRLSILEEKNNKISKENIKNIEKIKNLITANSILKKNEDGGKEGKILIKEIIKKVDKCINELNNGR